MSALNRLVGLFARTPEVAPIPVEPLKITKVATRGASSRPTMPSRIGRTSGPETRTTPMPA